MDNQLTSQRGFWSGLEKGGHCGQISPIAIKGYRIDFQPDPANPDKIIGSLSMIGNGQGDDICQIFELLKSH
jgi:hypothetical protein